MLLLSVLTATTRALIWSTRIFKGYWVSRRGGGGGLTRREEARKEDAKYVGCKRGRGYMYARLA